MKTVHLSPQQAIAPSILFICAVIFQFIYFKVSHWTKYFRQNKLFVHINMAAYSKMTDYKIEQPPKESF